jgi:hypothetical protein
MMGPVRRIFLFVIRRGKKTAALQLGILMSRCESDACDLLLAVMSLIAQSWNSHWLERPITPKCGAVSSEKTQGISIRTKNTSASGFSLAA